MYWFVEDDNLGDKLSPIIVETTINVKPNWVNPTSRKKLLALGSIIENALPGDVVWGTGSKTPIRIDGKLLDILAVRGPRTAENLGLTSKVFFGDPGMLLPKVYKPSIYTEEKILLIPHYVDYEIIKNDLNKNPKKNDYEIVDIANESYVSVVNKIARAKFVVSSSLHGLIFAEAYEKPAVWLKVSNKIIGGEYKFHDYYESDKRKNEPLIYDSDFQFIKKSKAPKIKYKDILEFQQLLINWKSEKSSWM